MVINISKVWATFLLMLLIFLIAAPYVYLEWQARSFRALLVDEIKDMALLPPPPPPHDKHDARFGKPSDLPHAIYPKVMGSRPDREIPDHHVVYFLTRKLDLSSDVQKRLSDIISRYAEQRKILQGKIAVEVQLMAELNPSDENYMQRVTDTANIQADISKRVMRLFAEQQVEIYQLLSEEQVETLDLIKHQFAQKMKARIAKDRTKGIFSFESGDIESSE